MKLAELSITDFIDLLSTSKPAPGGGSSAALAGAIGIALTSMVANLTVNKEKYKEEQELMQEILKETTDLKKCLIEVIDKDTEAYNTVANALRLPKNTEEEKNSRSIALQKALKTSTIVPFNLMILALSSLRVTQKAVGKSNINVITDLGIAALTLKTSIQSAWLNVIINLKSIKDEVFVKEYEARSNSILKEALPIADSIYNKVQETLLK